MPYKLRCELTLNLIISSFILISEFFIPSLGHFLAGKYYLAIIKLTLLLVIPILSFLIGFLFYYKEGNHHVGSRGNANSMEYNEDNDHHLHVANREEKGVDLSIKMPVIISMVSWGFCAGMHIIDIIFYYAPIGLGCYFAALVGTFGKEIAVGFGIKLSPYVSGIIHDRSIVVIVFFESAIFCNMEEGCYRIAVFVPVSRQCVVIHSIISICNDCIRICCDL